MNREEFNKIKQSLKDPNFHDILQDYMLEISDPKNKQEHDEYLLQMQKDGDLPKDMKLVKPEAFFCIETRIASETDKKFTQRLFVNICTSDQVEEAKSTSQNAGSNWSVPYMVGRLRYDQDEANQDTKLGKIISVIDVVFHPNVIPFAMMSKEFKKMICDIAIDGVDGTLAQKKEKLDRDYKVLEDTCVGGAPSILPIRMKTSDGSRAPIHTEKPKLYHEMMNEREKHEKAKLDAVEPQPEIEEEAVPEDKEAETDQNDSCIPKYKLTYSYNIDSDEFIECKYKNVKKPRGLNLDIQMPKVENAAGINCDLDNNVLTLEYENVYFLNLSLPIKVDQVNYKARFDKKTKNLKLSFNAIFDSQPVTSPQIVVNSEPDTEIDSSQHVSQNDAVEQIADEKTPELSNEENLVAQKEEISVPEMLEQPTYEKPLPDDNKDQPLVVEINEESDESKGNDNMTAIESSLQHIDSTATAVSEISEIPVYNKQKLDDRLFVILNFPYKQENLMIMHNSTSLVILHNSQYCCLKIDQPIDELEIQDAKDFLTLILVTKCYIDGVKQLKFNSLADLTEFINSENLTDFNLKSKDADKKVEEENAKQIEEFQTDEIPGTKEEPRLERKEDLDYNFMMLSINEDAFAMV